MLGDTRWALLRRLHAPVYRHRVRVLAELIQPHLEPGDRVLDIGCGSGELGRALLDAPGAPAGLAVLGLEKTPRAGALIDVVGYAGDRIPYPDHWADAVVLADVLHHEPDSDALLREAARVCGRVLIIKDHAAEGPLAHERLSVLDWAANRPYGRSCLYRYRTVEAWRRVPRELGLDPVEERTSVRLYPRPFDGLFGGRLQYFAVLRTSRHPEGA